MAVIKTQPQQDGLIKGFKLMDSFRSQVKKMKTPGIDNRAEFDVGYPTGFLALDFLNGMVIHVKTKNMNITYNSIGIVDGSANTFIGRSGCGKSTFVLQAGANIIKPFPLGRLYIDDIEKSLPQYRKEVLIGIPKEEFDERVDIRNTGITTENVFERIKLIHDIKLEHRNEFEYDTGYYDTDGNRIFKLQPTVYIIDSLPMLMPEDVATSDELGNNMTGGQTAKKNTELVKKLVQLATEANIILFTINHILDDIKTSQYQADKRPIQGLKEGERLPGGRTAVYLGNNMFRLDDRTKLKPTEGFGIDGSIVELTIVKSRSNKTLKTVPLIFNKTEGKFDEELSLFYLLKTEGKVSGAGAYLYFDGAPDVKFAQKNFKEKLHNSPELQQSFAKEARTVLDGFLSDMEIEDTQNTLNINDMILSMVA